MSNTVLECAGYIQLVFRDVLVGFTFKHHEDHLGNQWLLVHQGNVEYIRHCREVADREYVPDPLPKAHKLLVDEIVRVVDDFYRYNRTDWHSAEDRQVTDDDLQDFMQLFVNTYGYISENQPKEVCAESSLIYEWETSMSVLGQTAVDLCIENIDITEKGKIIEGLFSVECLYGEVDVCQRYTFEYYHYGTDKAHVAISKVNLRNKRIPVVDIHIDTCEVSRLGVLHRSIYFLFTTAFGFVMDSVGVCCDTAYVCRVNMETFHFTGMVISHDLEFVDQKVRRGLSHAMLGRGQ